MQRLKAKNTNSPTQTQQETKLSPDFNLEYKYMWASGRELLIVSEEVATSMDKLLNVVEEVATLMDERLFLHQPDQAQFLTSANGWVVGRTVIFSEQAPERKWKKWKVNING